MSCSSCSSCGPVSAKGKISKDYLELQELILDSQMNWSIPLDELEEEKWDLRFNDIGMRLSNNNIQSLKPLLEIFDEFGPKKFLEVSHQLCMLQMTGNLICWGFLYSQQNLQIFLKNIENQDVNMINYVNKEASIFQMFKGNPKIGRAISTHEEKEKLPKDISQLQKEKPSIQKEQSIQKGSKTQISHSKNEDPNSTSLPYLLSISVIIIGFSILVQNYFNGN